MDTESDLKQWIRALQNAIGDYCLKFDEVMHNLPTHGAPSIEQQNLNSDAEAKIHVVINAAHHMFRAAIVVGSDEALVDQSLKELVRHLRNLREHWDENKKYFRNRDLVIPKGPNTISVRWFKEHFPDSTPWSGGWTNLCGYTSGPLYLGQLYEQANRFLFIINQEKEQL